MPSVIYFFTVQCNVSPAGQTIPVETGNLPTEPPAWYDPIKFQRGQEFARRHFAGVSLAHFVSLLAALNAPQILKVFTLVTFPAIT